MKTMILAPIIMACVLAVPCQANDHPFEGPRVGLEMSYEDYQRGQR